MISALIAKDLYLQARDKVFNIVICGYLVVFLTASLIFIYSFLSADGYQFAAASALLFFRISVFQGLLLAVLTPWLILRMQERELIGPSGSLGSGMLAPPWKIILAKLIASAICLSFLIILTLPAHCLARLMGAATFHQIAWMLTDTFLFLLVLTILIFHLRLQFKSWLSSWILSYATMGILIAVWYKIWSSAGRESCSMVFLLFVIFFLALLFPHGNRALLYERN